MVARLLAFSAVLALASPAAAAINIFNAPGAVQPPENVLIDDGLTGQTVFGHTNNTNTSVSFLSLANGVTLAGFANGQARVEAVGGPLDTLRFFLTSGQGFDEVEFDLHKADGATGNVTVNFFGSFGTQTRTFALGNGNNWFAAETTGGDVITAVSFDTDGTGVDDIRQVRLGVVSGVVSAVPEPATWAMMLGGFGVIGASMRRRSRAAVLS